MNRLLLTISFGILTIQISAQNISTRPDLAFQPGSVSSVQPTNAVVLKGIVRTSDGKPAAFVNVQLKDTKNGTMTNEFGEYFFYNIAEGKYMIVVSYVGLKTIQSEIEVKKGEISVYDFVLSENKNELEEIIVRTSYTINEKTLPLEK
jgi:hypothetical protein